MNDYTLLEPTQTLPKRSFADPERNADDLAAMDVMADCLRQLLRQPGLLPTEPRPLILNLGEEDGRWHRAVISQVEELLKAQDLTAVGFFGHKVKDMNHAVLDDLDRALVTEFVQHPGVLSYSSLELSNGDHGNLVLLNPPEAKEHWRTSTRHVYAAQELSPQHYECVRLHNGCLPGGLMSGNAPVLQRTKYYDYRGGETWRAVRELMA